MTDDGWGDPQTAGEIYDLNTGVLVGTYTGYKEVLGTYGISQLHSFDTDDGIRKVWGKTHLDGLLAGRQGELVKVAMTGNKIKTGSGDMVEYVLWSKGRASVPPPLPERPLDAPLPAPGSPAVPEGQSEAQMAERQKRAMRLAMAAKDAGLDDKTRKEFIGYCTWGRTDSGHEVTPEEASEIFLQLQRLRTNKIQIRFNEDGNLYIVDEAGKALK